MPTNETCNGYTNYDTFLIAVTVDNNYELYTAKMNWFKDMASAEVTIINAVRAKRAATMMGVTRVARIESSCKVSNVDWNDIAESWQTDYEEFLREHQNVPLNP